MKRQRGFHPRKFPSLSWFAQWLPDWAITAIAYVIVWGGGCALVLLFIGGALWVVVFAIGSALHASGAFH